MHSLVVGGGLLGAALARAETALGHQVTVASRHPRHVEGLWRRYSLAEEPCWRAPDRVFVAVAPAAGEKPEVAWGPALGTFLRRMERLPLVIVGPAAEPAFAPSGRIAILRVPTLFGVDDRYAWPLAQALRTGERASVPRDLPAARALWVDDVARAASRLCGAHGDWTIAGPDLLDVPALMTALVARFGGEWRSSFWSRGWRRDELRRARAQASLDAAWDEVRFGPVTPFAAWAERLPGPRRRR